jgi:uncharacterized protein
MRSDPAYAHLLRTMDRAMFDRILEGMSRIEAAHGVPADSTGARPITLFGGEPLLAESREIVEYIVRTSQARGPVRFSAISNATDLHAYRDLLGPSDIGFIQVTIDGPPREHDKRRIYADRSGSFARIAENMTMALDRGVEICVRMNVDRRNVNDLPELAEEFIRRGWDKHPGFYCYVATVHAASEHITDDETMNSWMLAQMMKDLAKSHPSIRIMGNQDDPRMEQARDVFHDRADPFPTFKAAYCGAHVGEYVIDPFGDIYACWERTGDPSTRIGAVGEGGEVRMNGALTKKWRSRNVTSNPSCRKCRYAAYCGGGCAVRGEAQHGTELANHCDGYAARFRANVAAAYGEYVAGVRPERRSKRACDQ